MIKLKKLLIFILTSILFISACSNEVIIRSDDIKLSEFKNRELKSPKNIVSSIDDLSYLMDYMTFYKLEEPITIKIDDEFKNSIYNIKLILNEAKEKSLISDVFHIDYDINKYKSLSIITLRLYKTEVATIKSEGNSEIKLIPSFNKEIKEEKNNTYYLENNNKGYLSVVDSEQLYYAIINGYMPICKVGSAAEDIYLQMIDILNRIYSDDEFNMLKNIYDFLTHEVKYDNVAQGSSDFNLERNQAYFLEGVFLNRLAVCDGLSKAYSMMCNYVGIENVRIRASNDNLALHSYNYVNLFDTWYLSCPTSGSHRVRINDVIYQIPSYNMMLTTLKTPYKDDWSYKSLMHKDIEECISKEEYPYYLNNNLYLNSYDEILKLIKDGMSVEFKTSLDDSSMLLIKDELEKVIGKEVIVLKQRSTLDNIYTIFLL